MSRADVLVTGASGFIGGRLIARLAAEGLAVRATSRRAPESLPAGVEFLPADLAAPQAAERLAAGVRRIVNAAGQLGGPGVGEEAYRRANAEAPLLLVEAAAAAGVEAVVHVSTVGVLGETGGRPAGEETPARPSNPYETTKWEGERAAREAGERLGLPVTVLRPALVYGPGDRHLLALFRAVSSPLFFHVGGGRALTHPVYIDDVTEALALAVRSAAPPREVFHVAGPRPVPFRDLIAGIARARGLRPPGLSLPRGAARALALALEAASRPFGLSPPLTRDRVEALTTNRAFDISRAASGLGWTPSVGLEEGLARTVGWYREHGLL